MSSRSDPPAPLDLAALIPSLTAKRNRHAQKLKYGRLWGAAPATEIEVEAYNWLAHKGGTYGMALNDATLAKRPNRAAIYAEINRLLEALQHEGSTNIALISQLEIERYDIWKINLD